jgi:nucleotide-binding universal stress UspA family protein
MAGVQKFLVAIDGSEGARHAVGHAIDLAKQNAQVQLHLLTVHPEPVIYGEIQVYVSRAKMEELQRLRSLDILRPAEDIVRSAQVPFASEIITGEAAQSIVRRAEELGCAGIIMGSRDMGAVGNLVLGSITTKVLHLTKLPVTVVK